MKQILRAKIYGDSIMKGTILDAGYRYHAIMNEYLIRLYERFGIEAENRARFGITVKRGHSILLRDIDEGLDCELALVEFGGNDSDFDWAAVAAAPHDIAETGGHSVIFACRVTVRKMCRGECGVAVRGPSYAHAALPLRFCAAVFYLAKVIRSLERLEINRAES